MVLLARAPEPPPRRAEDATEAALPSASDMLFRIQMLLAPAARLTSFVNCQKCPFPGNGRVYVVSEAAALRQFLWIELPYLQDFDDSADF